MQPEEVDAELAALIAFAGLNAEQVGIRTVCAFAQGYANLGDRDMAGTADREEILALPEMFAASQIFVIFDKAENSTAHENMRMGAMIRFNLFEAFIGPINAIPAVDHNTAIIQMCLKWVALPRFRSEWLT